MYGIKVNEFVPRYSFGTKVSASLWLKLFCLRLGSEQISYYESQVCEQLKIKDQ